MIVAHATLAGWFFIGLGVLALVLMVVGLLFNDFFDPPTCDRRRRR